MKESPFNLFITYSSELKAPPLTLLNSLDQRKGGKVKIQLTMMVHEITLVWSYRVHQILPLP